MKTKDLNKLFNIKPQKFSVKLSGNTPQQLSISKTGDAAKIIKSCFDKLNWREQVLVFPMNAMNQVLGVYTLSEGSINSCIVDCRVLFQVLLLSNASSFILAHNHPSQNPEPSNEDIVTTRRIKTASKLLGIRLLDHLIITENSITSCL